MFDGTGGCNFDYMFTRVLLHDGKNKVVTVVMLNDSHTVFFFIHVTFYIQNHNNSEL